MSGLKKIRENSKFDVFRIFLSKETSQNRRFMLQSLLNVSSLKKYLDDHLFLTSSRGRAGGRAV